MTLAQTRIHSHTKHEHAPIMFLQRHRQMHTQMKIKTYTAHTHTLAWAHKLLHKRVNVKLPAFTTLQANISKGGRKSWSSSQLSEFPPFLLTLSSSWKGNTNSWKLTPYTKLKLNSQPVNRNLQVCNSDLPHALWPLTWQRRSASGRKEGGRERSRRWRESCSIASPFYHADLHGLKRHVSQAEWRRSSPENSTKHLKRDYEALSPPCPCRGASDRGRTNARTAFHDSSRWHVEKPFYPN